MPLVRSCDACTEIQPFSPPTEYPAAPLTCESLPKPTLAFGVKVPGAWRRKIWITPPIASEPYRLENGPRTISMRWIWSTGMSWIAVRPALAEPTRIPSTSTSTWSPSVPRRNSEDCLPGPPLLLIAMPGVTFSRSCSDDGCNRSIWLRVITVTGTSVASWVCAVRVAVTTICGRVVVWPSASDVMETQASATSNARPYKRAWKFTKHSCPRLPARCRWRGEQAEGRLVPPRVHGPRYKPTACPVQEQGPRKSPDETVCAVQAPAKGRSPGSDRKSVV